MNLANYKIFTLLLLVYAVSGSKLLAESGGACQYFEYQLLAKVNSYPHHKKNMKVVTAEHGNLVVPVSMFRFDVNKGDFVSLQVREHTSGGCSPFDLQSVSKLAIKNLDMEFDDGSLYQAAFLLETLKQCASGSRHGDCNSELTRFMKFSKSELSWFKKIKPKTIQSCSIEKLTESLRKLKQSNSEPAFIACVKTDSNEEKLLLFKKVKAKGNPVRLLRTL